MNAEDIFRRRKREHTGTHLDGLAPKFLNSNLATPFDIPKVHLVDF